MCDEWCGGWCEKCVTSGVMDRCVLCNTWCGGCVVCLISGMVDGVDEVAGVVDVALCDKQRGG